MDVKKKFIKSLIVMLIVAIHVKAQDLSVRNVSVINQQGHVRIDWLYGGSEDLIIKRDNIEQTNGLVEIARRPAGVGTFIDTEANAHLAPRAYVIVSSLSPDVIVSKIVSTIHMEISYDSCASTVNIRWRDLKHENYFQNEWIAQRYIIHANIDGVQKNKVLEAPNQQYSFNDIPENVDNTFYVETQWTHSNQITSNSNSISLFTKMLIPPDYIRALSASAHSDKVELKFGIAPNNQLNKFIVFKSDKLNGQYNAIDTMNSFNSEILYSDAKSEPNKKVNYYKLVAVDACNRQRTQSDVSNNIVLQATNNDFNNLITWNEFKPNAFAYSEYDIYRKIGDNQDELISQITQNTSLTDNVEQLQGDKLSGQFCYYLKARKTDNPNEYSQSNTVCVYLKPRILAPDAFTPNGDGVNDIFNAVFTFLPISFEMKIYSRWGNLVYQTKDANKGWDGKQNGKSVATGTYIYSIKIKTPGNQAVEKIGNITVFYP